MRTCQFCWVLIRPVTLPTQLDFVGTGPNGWTDVGGHTHCQRRIDGGYLGWWHFPKDLHRRAPEGVYSCKHNEGAI